MSQQYFNVSSQRVDNCHQIYFFNFKVKSSIFKILIVLGSLPRDLGRGFFVCVCLLL